MVGQLTEKSAAYIAGYVTKKMTHASDIRLDGRHPEFARMSNGGRMKTGGLGATAMMSVASAMMQYQLDRTLLDVPSALRHGRRIMPLGKYLKKKLREAIGRDGQAPPEVLQAAFERLSLLRRFAFENDRSVASVFAEINQPYADQMAARIERGKHETL